MKTVGKMVLTLVAMLTMVATTSAAEKLVVKDNATPANNVFAVQDTGVTTISNKTGADTNTTLAIQDINGNKVFDFLTTGFLAIGGPITGEYRAKSWSNDPNARPVFVGQRHKGTFSSPAAVTLNDKLGTFAFGGYDGSAIVAGALLEVFVDGAVATNSVPARMSIVTGSSSSNRAERVVVKSGGNVGIGTSDPKALLHSTGSTIVGAASAANADADLGNNQCNMWLNEATNALTFKCKYSTGAIKSATVTLQ